METGSQQTAGVSERARVIDTLVGTYRELNTRYRPIGDDVLQSSGARDVIERMRYDEMLFAQALKERLTGVGTASLDGDAGPAGMEPAADSTVNLISQFGNARATTLTLLKQAAEADWTKPLDDGKTILLHAQDLAESDRNQLARLAGMVTGR